MIRKLPATASVRRILSFPGQGQLLPSTFLPQLSQGHDLSSFRDLLSSGVSRKFSEALFDLDSHPNFFLRSSNLQPAIVSTSLLLLRLLKSDYKVNLKASYVIGHSLGELTCLLLNQVFDPDLAPLIAHKRGLFMEEAIANYNSDNRYEFGMTALIFSSKSSSEAIIREIIRKYKTVSIANQNLQTQYVLAGESRELRSAIEEIQAQSPSLVSTVDAKKAPPIKTVPLKVRIPFHNELLNESKYKFRYFIETSLPKIEPSKQLEVPILSNLNGLMVTTHGEALDNFIDCFTKPVQFYQSIQNLLEAPDTEDIKYEVLNLGPNSNVIQGLMKRLNNGKIIRNLNVECKEDFESVKQLIGDFASA